MVALWFVVVSTKPGPKYCVLCDIDGLDPSVLIISQARRTFSIQPQDILNGWQHFHDMLFVT